MQNSSSLNTPSQQTLITRPVVSITLGTLLSILIVIAPYPSMQSDWSHARSSAKVVPTVQQATSANTGSRTFGVSGIPWEVPRSNWLYVLDYVNDPAGDASGQVLVIDPQGQVHGRIITGFTPDIVLSPDGTRLYLASKDSVGDTLSVIDTATGS